MQCAALTGGAQSNGSEPAMPITTRHRLAAIIPGKTLRRGQQ
jgi:hypothetical protein